MIIINL